MGDKSQREKERERGEKKEERRKRKGRKQWLGDRSESGPQHAAC